MFKEFIRTSKVLGRVLLGFLFAYAWLLVCNSAVWVLEDRMGSIENIPAWDGIALGLGGIFGSLFILYWFSVKGIVEVWRLHRGDFKTNDRTNTDD